MIPNCRCPYCQHIFQPSPYRVQQRVCSQAECQRHRRADYHRRKIQADPVYAQVVLDSRKQWRAEHADYQKPQRAFVRMEPKPGERFEVDWGHFESLDYQGDQRKLYAFALVDGHSRMQARG